MSRPLDIRQLRRVAEPGDGRDEVRVTRDWLRAALREIEQARGIQWDQPPILDIASPVDQVA